MTSRADFLHLPAGVRSTPLVGIWPALHNPPCMSELTYSVPGLEPVLITSELAAYLGVPVQTIHDLRHHGREPRGIRVGRELRFRLSESKPG